MHASLDFAAPFEVEDKVFIAYSPEAKAALGNSVSSAHPPAATQNENTNAAVPTATLLLVEDNRDDAQLLQRLIVRQYPYLETVWLRNGDKVLPYLESTLGQQAALPTMVLLDLYLPSAERGLRVLQTIKSHQQYKQLPVVVLSRSEHPDDIAQALSYSADAYVVKPSEPQQWLKKLAWLQQYFLQTNVDSQLAQ
jgi:CheY-like chemotaxis protein